MKTLVSKKDILHSMVVAIVLSPLAVFQYLIHPEAQFIFLVLALSTITGLCTVEIVGDILFYTLLAFAVFIIGFVATYYFISLIDPNRGWGIDQNNHRNGVIMDVSILLGVPVGIFLAPLALWLYKKKAKPANTVKLVSVIVYGIASLVVFIVSWV